MTAVEQIIDLQ